MNEAATNHGGSVFVLLIAAIVIVAIWKFVDVWRVKKKKMKHQEQEQKYKNEFITAEVPEVKENISAVEGKPVESLLHTIEVEDNTSSLDALNISLRRGFNVLKLLMIILAVIFLFSNIFWVDEGFVAVQTRFGRIVDRNSSCVTRPGGPYFALPAPMDRVLKLPTTLRKVDINNAFWLEEGIEKEFLPQSGANGQDYRNPGDTLVPGYDGSLITADKNVVQGQWAVNYQLDCCAGDSKDNDMLRDFVNNVGTMNNADQLVRKIIIESLVKVVAQTTVDDFIRGKINYTQLAKYAQAKLDRLNTGIILRSITGKKYTVALCLQDDFRAVNLAQSEKAEQIESAKRYRSRILNETAGAGYETLIGAIYRYEAAVTTHDKQKIAKASKVLSRMLRSNVVGGRISETFSRGISYKTQVVESTRGASQRFELMLSEYNAHPVIFRNRLVQDALQSVFSGHIKTFYLPPSNGKTLYLELSK